tara:strand:+ start:2486 stop:2917 length:432 start_codon:yes stop_codon:yes gene_type:complete
VKTASEAVSEQATRSMLAKNATGVIILDLRKLSSLTDFFVIGTASSEPQIKAIVEQITGDLKEKEIVPWHTEGKQNWRWVLLDYVDVVIHVFRNETRSFYDLERLWGDAPKITVSVDDQTGEIIHSQDMEVTSDYLKTVEHEV